MLLLVGFWVVAIVVLAGMTGMFLSGWLFLGIPLALVLLFVGAMLTMRATEPEWDEGPVIYALGVMVFVGLGAGLVATIMVGMWGPQIYHEHYGERTTAVITYLTTTNNESGGVSNYLQHVEDATTGADLGWLAQDPLGEPSEGDRLEVSVDPRGWVPPVPVDRMGGTGIPAIVLACCFGAVALTALATIATAARASRTRPTEPR